jgi:hypothetical protein
MDTPAPIIVLSDHGFTAEDHEPIGILSWDGRRTSVDHVEMLAWCLDRDIAMEFDHHGQTVYRFYPTPDQLFEMKLRWYK